tara:strand:- start:200 stop:805 length:606 start_codon:yes stop_codon:yes gene_type:complete
MIEVIDCPFASEIKDNIISWINTQKVIEIAFRVRKTQNYNKIYIPEIKRLFNWIEDVVPDAADKLARWTNSLYNSPRKGIKDVKRFKIDSYWALNYPLHSYIGPHNHFPNSISFGYYVHTPENSSSFLYSHKSMQEILEDPSGYEEQPVKEGQLFLFNSSLIHWVADAIVPNRTMISGDLIYLSRFSKEEQSIFQIKDLIK